jgi:hypothetical protein
MAAPAADSFHPPRAASRDWIGILRRNHRQPHFSETNSGRPQPMPTDDAPALHSLCTRSAALSLCTHSLSLSLVPAAQRGSNVVSHGRAPRSLRCRSPTHGRDGVCDERSWLVDSPWPPRTCICIWPRLRRLRRHVCSDPPSDMTCRNSSIHSTLSCLVLPCLAPSCPAPTLPCPVLSRQRGLWVA